MASETLYTPSGAGHSAPDGEPRRYVQPRQPLLDAFASWLKMLEGKDQYNDGWRAHFSTESLKGVDLRGATCEEINSILVPFEGHPELQDAGIFLTRAYEMAGIEDVVFESDVHIERVKHGMVYDGIEWLGRNSWPGMNFVLKSDTGMNTAMQSRGIALNYCTSRSLGVSSPGVLVNYGEVSGTFGMNSDGILVNFGEAVSMNPGEYAFVLQFGGVRTFNESRPLVMIHIQSGEYQLVMDWITGYEFTDEMKQYLDGLRDRIGPHRDYRKVLAYLKGADIKADIMRLARPMGLDLPEEDHGY